MIHNTMPALIVFACLAGAGAAVIEFLLRRWLKKPPMDERFYTCDQQRLELMEKNVHLQGTVSHLQETISDLQRTIFTLQTKLNLKNKG